eukprot:719556_1
MCLGKSIAEVFGIAHTNIEIGHTRMTKYGCITHIVHYVDHDDLEAMQQELQQSPRDKDPPSISAISASYFTENLYLSLQSDITTVMRNHFKLNGDFDVEYTLSNRTGVRKKSKITDTMLNHENEQKSVVSHIELEKSSNVEEQRGGY